MKKNNRNKKMQVKKGKNASYVHQEQSILCESKRDDSAIEAGQRMRIGKIHMTKFAVVMLVVRYGIPIIKIFIILGLLLLAIKAFASENEQIRAGKDILASISSNQKEIEGMDASHYQKDINKEVADWTKNLEKKLNSDVKSKKQIVEPRINITEENKKTAYEIIENSQSIVHEALETSSDMSKYTRKELYTDFLIFTSFSIGEKNLENLIKLASEYNGAVILRGFKNGSVKDTAAFISNISSTKEGVLIDPNLFKEYQITKVPTFVLTKPCEGVIDGSNCKLIYDKLVGNVSPRYALERFAARGELSVDAKERLGR